MSWHVSEDVELFLAAAGDLLLGEPGRHTVQLTACENARAGTAGFRFAWWTEPSGEVTAAASLRPPYPLFVTSVPDHAVLPLVQTLRPTSVAGPTESAVQVAGVAAHVQGRTASLRFAERLFRLGSLVTPQVQGRARAAGEDDIPLLVSWFLAFVDETGVIPGDEEESVRDRVSYDGFVLWTVDGEPVAVAGHSRIAFGSARLGPVYTPPEHRGHGYGGAATAAASQQVRDRGGAEGVLFTDLANPTSNALYRRLGFEPVQDFAVLDIT
jgi:ribosomal protein S18 acetylase RimI-like enzyme